MSLPEPSFIDRDPQAITAEIVALETPIDEAIKADEARRAAEKAERERIEAERVAKHQQAIDLNADEDDLDPRWELVHQLLQYKKFKEAAGQLGQMSLDAQNMLPRPASAFAASWLKKTMPTAYCCGSSTAKCCTAMARRN